MVVTCIMCKSTAKKSEEAISFHTFPKDDIAKQNWLRALGLTNVADSSRICSAHFADNDFVQSLTGTRRNLKKDAVPSLNERLQHINETRNVNVRQEEEDNKCNVMRIAPVKRSNNTENYEDIPCTKYRRIGDINVDEVCTSPAEAKLCLQVAIETVQEQRKKIRKLQTSNNKLRKSISNFKEFLGELKEKNCLSSEACDILDKIHSKIPKLLKTYSEDDDNDCIVTREEVYLTDNIVSDELNIKKENIKQEVLDTNDDYNI